MYHIYNCNTKNEDYYSILVIGLKGSEPETRVWLEEDKAFDENGNCWEVDMEQSTFDDDLEMYTTIALKEEQK